jgi:hypothetical protein
MIEALNPAEGEAAAKKPDGFVETQPGSFVAEGSFYSPGNGPISGVEEAISARRWNFLEVIRYAIQHKKKRTP